MPDLHAISAKAQSFHREYLHPNPMLFSWWLRTAIGVFLIDAVVEPGLCYAFEVAANAGRPLGLSANAVYCGPEGPSCRNNEGNLHMLMKFGKFCAFAGVLLCSTPSLAYDWSVSGHVTVIEGTYMPASLNFQMDVAGGTCAAGSWLNWNLRGADATSRNINVQSVLSVLLTAKSSGQKVTLYGNNSGCTIDFIYLQ